MLLLRAAVVINIEYPLESVLQSELQVSCAK